jgi:hypothetical protein
MLALRCDGATCPPLLLAFVLGSLGCVSDFSPDPFKGNPNELPARDAGRDVEVGEKDAGEGGKDAGPATRRDAADATREDASNGAGEEGEPTSKGGCDLSGRWLMSERGRTVALGAEQLAIGWFYVELEQRGSAITMRKTLTCGQLTQQAPGSPAVNMDDSASWPAYQQFTNYDGRTGSVEESGAGCKVSFDRSALVKGMTPAAYALESSALPSAAEEASGATPGWEDWDADGEPGITMTITGLAQGKMYTAARTFASYGGSTDPFPEHFQLDYDWVQERIVYGTDPGDPITRSLLAADAQVSPKLGENFVEFGRLADDEATGDDDAKCEAVRRLVSRLNPAANPA